MITVVRHRVQKGDTIETLARKYGSDEKSILAANSMRRPGPLTVGATLRVPQTCPPERTASAPAASAKGAAAPKVIEHTVRKGDSLAALAKRYGTPPEEIQKQNQLKSTTLKAGQVLRIAPPAPTTAPVKADPPKAQAKAEPPVSKAGASKPKPETATPKTGVYAVRSGDTVYSIARRHNMAVDRLLALNHLDDAQQASARPEADRGQLSAAMQKNLIFQEAAL